MARLRFATVWLGGCSGCHMSFLDLDEWLFELANKVDVVFSPVADVKDFPENVDLTLVEGAVANAENEEMLLRVRQRTGALNLGGDQSQPLVEQRFEGLDNRRELVHTPVVGHHVHEVPYFFVNSRRLQQPPHHRALARRSNRRRFQRSLQDLRFFDQLHNRAKLL